MSNISDCAKCKATLSPEARASISCGYLPESDEHRAAWSHRSGKASPTTCAGYLVNLPEVIEAARARSHWKNGSLRDFCAEQPSENIMQAVEIIDGEANEVESFVMTEKR